MKLKYSHSFKLKVELERGWDGPPINVIKRIANGKSAEEIIDTRIELNVEPGRIKHGKSITRPCASPSDELLLGSWNKKGPTRKYAS
jgi:hypothetical protein